MDENFELRYHQLENKHWWFIGRYDIILKLIDKYNKKSQILDIGCSGGSFLQILKNKGFNNLHGIDISNKAIKLCRQKGLKNTYLMDISKIRFSKNSFDIVIASDIIEHVKNQYLALNNIKKILKPGGRLIIFVPAFKCLWSYHDIINHHQKRYHKNELYKKLNQKGFIIERLSYWNIILFFPAFIMKIANKLTGTYNRQSTELPLLNKILAKILKIENFILLLNINFPFGLSIFAIAKKPK